MPAELTWFKWEAYATWFSGFALLVMVYYFGALLYLIDKQVFALSTPAAVAISISGLVLGWALYDTACRSKFGENETALSVAGFVVLVALAYAFAKIYSGRGAFMQMGSLMGTIMAANVLMVIIPGQRKVVADLIAGRTPDPAHGKRGKQRSTHNNYLTLPVVFVMIAGHYPLAFATRFSWGILACLLIMGVAIRHFYNERHKGHADPWWTWGVAVALGLAIVGLSTFRAIEPPAKKRADAPASSLLQPVSFKQAENVILSRCSMCHAKEPVWTGIIVPPKGVMLETAEQIRAHATHIKLQAIYSRAMPPGNLTDMTGDERDLLERWMAGR